MPGFPFFPGATDAMGQNPSEIHCGTVYKHKMTNRRDSLYGVHHNTVNRTSLSLSMSTFQA